MIALETDRLTIGYLRPRSVVAVGLNLALNAGELVCLIGPNGAGKTTLMRTLAGMQPPLAGRVVLCGDDVHRMAPPVLARRLSIVLTERVDPGLLRAREVVALGRHPYTGWSGGLRADDQAIIDDALRAANAERLAQRQFRELSDGERQKIMIARALAQTPALLILDEPTAFLDLPRRVEIMRLLRHLATDHGLAVLVSTHDLDLALRTADRLWLLSAGGVLDDGAPEDLVLNGALAAAFNSEGAVFDPAAGAFTFSIVRRGVVRVSGGTPLRHLWTQRALERAGFAVAAPEDEPFDMRWGVEIQNADWRVMQGERVIVCASLRAVVETLSAD